MQILLLLNYREHLETQYPKYLYFNNKKNVSFVFILPKKFFIFYKKYKKKKKIFFFLFLK